MGRGREEREGEEDQERSHGPRDCSAKADEVVEEREAGEKGSRNPAPERERFRVGNRVRSREKPQALSEICPGFL